MMQVKVRTCQNLVIRKSLVRRDVSGHVCFEEQCQQVSVFDGV